MSSPKTWLYMGMAVLLLGLGAGFAMNDNQPYLHAAQHGLENARTQLGRVTPDKGGHRSKAIGHINEAIQEVKTAQVEHKNISFTANKDRN